MLLVLQARVIQIEASTTGPEQRIWGEVRIDLEMKNNLLGLIRGE